MKQLAKALVNGWSSSHHHHHYSTCWGTNHLHP